MVSRDIQDETDEVEDFIGGIPEIGQDSDDSDDAVSILSFGDQEERFVDTTEDEEEEDDSDDSDYEPASTVNPVSEPGPSTSAETEEDEEEDELIKAIKRESVKVREHPPIIHCDDFITDICCHPQNNLLAVASITGDAFFYKYTNEENTLEKTLELHEDACRDLEFSKDGSLLFSVSKDKTIMISDVESGKLKRFYEHSHTVAIYCVRIFDENVFATGDDDGSVKLWDMRQFSSKPIYQIKRNEEYISDMLADEGMNYLVASSGDGSITAVDLRERKFFMQSEPYEEELTCMGLFRNETKVLAATSKGTLYLYNWREFGLHSDAYQGPKTCVNRLVPITENIVVSAGDDGHIRATHLFPNRHLGVVGQHALAVESLDINCDGKLLASSSDQEVKFWPIGYFADLAKVAATKQTNETKRKELDFQLPSSKRRNVSDFFSDM